MAAQCYGDAVVHAPGRASCKHGDPLVAEHRGWDQWDKGTRRSGHKSLRMPKDAEWKTLSPGMSCEKAGESQNSNVVGGSKEMTDVVGPGAWGSETWARNTSEMFSQVLLLIIAQIMLCMGSKAHLSVVFCSHPVQ